jgi:hypothetical protein
MTSPAESQSQGTTKKTDMVSVPRHLLARLTTWRSCMSYNDSYFGEPAGELKRITADIDRLVDSSIE